MDYNGPIWVHGCHPRKERQRFIRIFPTRLPTLSSHPTLLYKCTHCFSVHVCTSRGEVNTMCCDTLFNCTNVLTAMHKLCFAVPCVLFTMVWLGRITCSSATLAFFGHQGKCGQNGGHSHHCNFPTHNHCHSFRDLIQPKFGWEAGSISTRCKCCHIILSRVWISSWYNVTFIWSLIRKFHSCYVKLAW